jgi:hypothetical protein
MNTKPASASLSVRCLAQTPARKTSPARVIWPPAEDWIALVNAASTSSKSTGSNWLHPNMLQDAVERSKNRQLSARIDMGEILGEAARLRCEEMPPTN